jgi:hypothetical protein
MKNKYVAALFIIFILVIAAIAFTRFNPDKEQASIEDSLIKSIDSTKATILQSAISAQAKISSSFMTEEQVAAEMAAITEIINPEKSTIKISKENNDIVNKEILNARTGSRYYSIAIESIKTENGGETYAVMDVYIDNSYAGLSAERQKLSNYFAAQNIKPKISSCITGVYDAKLTENDMRAKISDAMTSIKAKEVEGLNNDGLTSISAFSGNINSFVLSDNKKVNIQIAMRYSSYDNKTYIWIGSPLIPIEY